MPNLQRLVEAVSLRVEDWPLIFVHNDVEGVSDRQLAGRLAGRLFNRLNGQRPVTAVTADKVVGWSFSDVNYVAVVQLTATGDPVKLRRTIETWPNLTFVLVGGEDALQKYIGLLKEAITIVFD